MIGQLSDKEFKSLNHKRTHFYLDGMTFKALVPYGKNTLNHYIQHSDYSWTNYESTYKM